MALSSVTSMGGSPGTAIGTRVEQQSVDTEQEMVMQASTRWGWWTVFVKEVRENLRDRRALGMALLYGPLFGPVLFAVMTAFIVGKQNEDAEKSLSIPVIGAEHAPNLIGFLRQQGVTIKAAPADPEGAIRAQDEDVIVRLTPAFGEAWLAGEPAKVDLLLDESRQTTRATLGRIRALLDAYSGQIAALRLQVRGIDPQLGRPLLIARHDLSTARSRGATLLAMLPYFLILCAFLGGMYLAIDATAGERERQSLEPLMTTPVAPGQIMTGKLAATFVFAAASVVTCIIAFAIGLKFVPTNDLGFDLDLSPLTALAVMALLMPIALLAAAVQTIIASFARSFREAQTYLQFLMIIPAIPSLMLVINPIKPLAWMLATPLLGQSLLINQLARGDAPGLGAFALCTAGTLLAALAASALAVRLYSSERLALAV